MRYGTCFLCGKTGWLEEHHVYPGPFRDKSEKYGLKVGLCGESCHRNGRYAAHQCRKTSDALKQFWQIKYMMVHKASVADFRAAFGKNYLELDYYDDERSYPMNIIAISGRLTRDPELRTRRTLSTAWRGKRKLSLSPGISSRESVSRQAVFLPHAPTRKTG